MCCFHSTMACLLQMATADSIKMRAKTVFVSFTRHRLFTMMEENIMHNQTKMINAACNPIVDLVEHESRMQQVEVERPVHFQLSSDGKTLLLKYDGLELNGVVDRPLKHQLGGRAWGNSNAFDAIDHIWRQKFSADPAALEDELALVFTKHDLSIRYHQDAHGKNAIYGIVTPHFVDVNQLDFRRNFLEEIRSNSALQPNSQGTFKSDYGEVVELFDFDSPGFQSKYRYGLVYARNNGYEAYKVNWEREVVICTNGLTAWRGTKSLWKHTREFSLTDFIKDTVQEGLFNQQFLEERISTARETSLQQTLMTELMERLSLARATKKRIFDRLDIESYEVGDNEWALSQSLTWLGNHERHVPFSMKPKLIDLGTSILEKSLTETLRAQVEAGRNGRYGLLLPETF